MCCEVSLQSSLLYFLLSYSAFLLSFSVSEKKTKRNRNFWNSTNVSQKQKSMIGRCFVSFRCVPVMLVCFYFPLTFLCLLARMILNLLNMYTMPPCCSLKDGPRSSRVTLIFIIRLSSGKLQAGEGWLLWVLEVARMLTAAANVTFQHYWNEDWGAARYMRSSIRAKLWMNPQSSSRWHFPISERNLKEWGTRACGTVAWATYSRATIYPLWRDEREHLLGSRNAEEERFEPKLDRTSCLSGILNWAKAQIMESSFWYRLV